jgi:hypothetical protein
MLFLGVLVSLGVAGRFTAETAGVENVPRIWNSTAFTFRDFDGDARLDLAAVHPGPYNGDATRYSVQVHLSATGAHSTEVIGPAGGLQIRAIDVNNGNHFIDLVLTTAWSRQPVAILINDGNGNFSQVPPSAFPDAFVSSGGSSVSGKAHTIQDDDAPLARRTALHSQEKPIPRDLLLTASVSDWNLVLLSAPLLISPTERSPPRPPVSV